jgi:hypothetical protein
VGVAAESNEIRCVLPDYCAYSAMLRFSHVKLAILLGLVLSLLACKQTSKQRADLRPFESIFTYLDEIKLQGIKPSDAMAFAIDSAGAVYVIDKAYKQVKKFDKSGHLIQTIGSPGKGPGLFVLPWNLTCDVKDNLYVLDLAQSRVNVFDSKGNLQRSFIFSPVGFSGTSIVVSRSGDIYLGGWKSPLATSSTMVHKFDQEGNHISSFLPVDQQVTRLNLDVVAGVEFAIDGGDNLYAVQRVNPMFLKFSPTGEFLGQFGRRPPFYQEPVKYPKLEYPRDESRIEPLLAEWTQLNGILTLPDGLVLLVFRTHTPKEFAIEIYDENGNVLEGSVGSDAVPVMQDRENRLYFLQSPSGSERSDYTTLSICTINLAQRNPYES